MEWTEELVDMLLKEDIANLKFQKNEYLIKLMIADHLRECSQLYDLYKLKERSWNDVRRELTDLFILLTAEVDAGILKARIDRFNEKQSKSK